ncbi:MAG: hypothetical protein WAN65_23105 [Candidatus Sulfotelmatobacter sp.]
MPEFKAQPLKHNDIRTGMSLVQTVYAVAMTYGLKNVVETSYLIFFSPNPARSSPLHLYVITFAFAAVMLLAVRFFWVPRNLYDYVLKRFPQIGDKVFARLTLFQIPIALGHAVLFFFVCHAFDEMANPRVQLGHASVGDLALRFVGMYAALLLLNALWLYGITSDSDDGPARKIWARSNLICALSALLLLGVFHVRHFSADVFISAACGFFVANGLFDLLKAAKHYIVFEN